VISVRITSQLGGYTHEARKVEVEEAKSVRGVVKELERRFPGIGGRILDDQENIRPYVNVFVNRENVRDLEGEETPLRDGDVVHILPSVAGG
jgi:sulfur-carrier protein